MTLVSKGVRLCTSLLVVVGLAGIVLFAQERQRFTRGIEIVGHDLLVYNTPTGGDSGYGSKFVTEPVAGTAGLRQGAIDLDLTRLATAALTAWDGNPDTALNIRARNYANNTAGGGIRALDISARNSGTTQTWVKTFDLGARNDSGKTITSLIAQHIRAENYGTVSDDIVGLDIEMSSENDTSSPTKDAILVRNTDASGMTGVGSVIKLTNTSTNGFLTLLDLDGLTAASNTLVSTSGTAATTFAARIRIITPNGSAGWINVYSTSNQ